MTIIDLSTQGLIKNWKGLAELIGLSYLEIRNLENKDDKMEILLNIWQCKGGTVLKLIDYIHRLDRFDILENPDFIRNILRDTQVTAHSITDDNSEFSQSDMINNSNTLEIDDELVDLSCLSNDVLNSCVIALN